jgi:hypothetical protein
VFVFTERLDVVDPYLVLHLRGRWVLFSNFNRL